MREHMIIAPGTAMDREWWAGGKSPVVFEDPTPGTVPWTFDPPDPVAEYVRSPVRTADLLRFHHPAWTIELWFYVDNRLHAIPDGYVLPGSVQGLKLESSPLYRWRFTPGYGRWDLMAPGEKRPVLAVTPEVDGQEWVAGLIAAAGYPPIPPRPSRPEPAWVPLSPEHVTEILDGES